jgi:hypothetical protein
MKGPFSWQFFFKTSHHLHNGGQRPFSGEAGISPVLQQRHRQEKPQKTTGNPDQNGVPKAFRQVWVAGIPRPLMVLKKKPERNPIKEKKSAILIFSRTQKSDRQNGIIFRRKKPKFFVDFTTKMQFQTASTLSVRKIRSLRVPDE